MIGLSVGDPGSCSGPVRCAQSMGAGDVNISPRASIRKWAMNCFGSLPDSLPSGMFTMRRLDRRNLFSRSSTRSRRCLFWDSRDFTLASAKAILSKFSPTLVSLSVRRLLN